jgi:hypothetical protein
MTDPFDPTTTNENSSPFSWKYRNRNDWNPQKLEQFAIRWYVKKYVLPILDRADDDDNEEVEVA